MSDLSSLNDKQLIKRHRYLADRVVDLKEKILPLFDEYEKIRVELINIDTELAKRNGLPHLESEDDKQPE
jgi:hypothetical protein